MKYEIRTNPKFNSQEIYFDGKPSEAIRTALKALKFRWHGAKKCWYGFAHESTIVDAILGTSTEEEPATVYTDGYLGGGAVYGSKSNLHLYGTDLAKAIRADIKNAGIKGVTIASKNGNIQATVTIAASDLIPKDAFIDSYQVTGSFGWVHYTDENGCSKSVSTCDYYYLPEDLKEKIRFEHAAAEYARDYATQNSLNHYHIDKYTGFTDAGRAKIKAVLAIIEAYRYDESNSMVDYFNTNFYIDIYTKPGKDVVAA